MIWQVPRISAEPLDVPLEADTRVYILGPNGSGKSALVQQLARYSLNRPVQRISAHRRTWLNSGTIDFTPASRKQWAENYRHYDHQADSRWREHDPASRQSAVLFDLVAQDNARARSIASHVDSQDWDGAKRLSSDTRSTFETLNELLTLGTLSVTVENSKGEQIFACHRASEAKYDIAKMSDGERSAVILAANVLTAERGTVFVIDEPERHLHRSIIEPFLSAVFSQRPDCSFVIATHEIGLPANDPGHLVLLVYSCSWEGEFAKEWDIVMLPSDSQLPDNLRRAILGSRKQVLFVEGTEDSLDCRLYRALFPTVSVMPVGNSRAVQEAVRGLRETHSTHSVRAFGVVDGDDRSADNVERLAKIGVFAIDASSVEGLYFCSDAIAAVARHQAHALQLDQGKMQESATHKALRLLGNDETAIRMASKRSERLIRERVLTELPDWQHLQSQPCNAIAVAVESPVLEERDRFGQMVADGDLDGLVNRYPIRESRAFDAVAKELRCQDRHDYCRMVVGQIAMGGSVGDQLRHRMPALTNAINQRSEPNRDST